MKTERKLNERELEVLGWFYEAHEHYLQGYRSNSYIKDFGLSYQTRDTITTLEMAGYLFIVGEYFVPVKTYAISEKGRQMWIREGMSPAQRIEAWNAKVAGK